MQVSDCLVIENRVSLLEGTISGSFSIVQFNIHIFGDKEL